MCLDELDMDSESFFEEEEAALEGLPVNESGLKELLDYLAGCDSLEGWHALLENFCTILGPEEFRKKLLLAKELFGEDWYR